jgi:restriction system protein
MAEYIASRMGEFLRIAISFLWDKPAGASTREIMEVIAMSTLLTAEETAPVPGASGFYQYEISIRTAMTALEKAGWLARDGNRWHLTQEGQLACKDFSKAEEFYTESQRIMAHWQANRPAIHLTIEYAREKAWEQIRRYLQNLARHEFRTLVRDLLLAMGHYVDWIAPPGKKRGHIDMIVVPDPLSPNSQQLVVQISHAEQVIPARELEELVSDTHIDKTVLCVASGGFTQEAVEYACSLVPGRIILMDLEKFVDLWVKHYDQLTNEARQHFPIETIPFLSLSE